MDLQEKRQLDLARQMTRVRVRARPWSSIIALILAVVVAVISARAGGKFSGWGEPGHLTAQVLTAATAAACLLSTISVLGLSGRARDVLRPLTGSTHAAMVRTTIVLAGGAGTLIITLALLKVPVGKLVLGAR